MLAPIVLFVYNRPLHTKQVMDALERNQLANESDLYIFADGPKENASAKQIADIEATRKLVKAKRNFRKVVLKEADSNMGLAQSVIKGLSQIFEHHSKVIVLEDDLIVAVGFLQYMNTSLEKYENEPTVMQISGYMFPIKSKDTCKAVFMPYITSWGWATWKRAWSHFDEHAMGYEILKSDKTLAARFNLNNSYPYSKMLFDQMETNSINSWAIRWWWTVFKNNGLVLHPLSSLVSNIGFGPNATHTKSENLHVDSSFVINRFIKIFPSKVAENRNEFNSVKKYLVSGNYHKSFFSGTSAINFIKGLFRNAVDS